jgi:hypothetical protein
MNELRPDIDKDGHGAFRDICTLYGDHHRAVFLEQILDSFIRGAVRLEIAAIRKAIRCREANLKTKGAKKGRPRGPEDQDWLRKAFRVAWRRHVLEMNWPDIARGEGLTPNKTAFRTLQRQRDQYAALIWRTLPAHASGPDLAGALKTKTVQLQLRWGTGMPFNTRPEECQKLVLALAPRGRRVDGNELTQWVKRRARKK